jgi:hypothetical protein
MSRFYRRKKNAVKKTDSISTVLEYINVHSAKSIDISNTANGNYMITLTYCDNSKEYIGDQSAEDIYKFSKEYNLKNDFELRAALKNNNLEEM